MKGIKKFIALLFAALFAGTLLLPLHQAAAGPAISIVVNGRSVEADAPPYVDAQNRTMVPLRLVAEALHYQVDWDSEGQKVTVQGPAAQVILRVGSKDATVSGRNVRMDTAAALKGGRTFVPLRFIAESMGAEVLWEPAFRRVVVNSTGTGALAVVQTDNVNVRQGPGTSFPAVGQARQGDKLAILEVGNGWLRVSLGNGKAGWIISSLVELAAAPAPPAPVPPAPQQPAPDGQDSRRSILVTADEANIRTGPGMNYPGVGSVYRGDRLPVTGQQGDWLAVELTSGRQGWVAASLVATQLPPLASREGGGAEPRQLPTLEWGDMSAPSGEAGSARSLTGVQVRQVEDRVVITLAASGPLEVKSMQLSSPSRLVLDLPGTGLAGGEPGFTLEVGHSQLQRVRGALFNDSARLVLDLAGGAIAQVKQEAGSHTLQVVVQKPGLAGRTIVLDPGHGSIQPGDWSDPGATGVGGLLERDVNMDIANRLAGLLVASGAEVLLTRTADTTLSLEGRANLANQLKADAFISIHANASPNPSLDGTATYFYAPWGSDLQGQRQQRQLLAQTVQDAMVQVVGRRDIGTLEANFAVLRYTRVPSILVETAFVTNKEEARLLGDAGTRQSFAEAIAKGVTQYFAAQQ